MTNPVDSAAEVLATDTNTDTTAALAGARIIQITEKDFARGRKHDEHRGGRLHANDFLSHANYNDEPDPAVIVCAVRSRIPDRAPHASGVVCCDPTAAHVRERGRARWLGCVPDYRLGRFFMRLRVWPSAGRSASIAVGDAVELDEGKSALTVCPRRACTLDVLMEGYDGPMPGEYDWGAPVGKEMW